tara:strand:- start:5063 stop:5338 length:276 start_codon:yes stop_codon:yes gene_type:complete
LYPLVRQLLNLQLQEVQVPQDPKCLEKTAKAKNIKALIKRGAAVLKKAMTIRDNAVVYISPEDGKKKMRKRKISLEAAFQKEKKSTGKRKR